MWRKSSHSIANGDCVEADGKWRKSSHSPDIGGNCAEVGQDGAWRKSSASMSNGHCAEVGQASAGVLVRDTKDRGGPVLAFDAAAWGAFLAMVRST